MPGSRCTFRRLLPRGDLLQLNEILAEVMFLPLLVAQALQKGCRGRTGKSGQTRPLPPEDSCCVQGYNLILPAMLPAGVGRAGGWGG